jgi:serine/threonine protein kinase
MDSSPRMRSSGDQVRETVRLTKSQEPSAAVVPLPEMPQRFGRYRILKPLGQGAMGTVYLAEDTQLGRRVALKTPSFKDDRSGALLERFYREAHSAATLQHPNICSVFDFGQIAGRHFISMAYIEGRTLAAYVQPDKPHPARRILIVVRKLALAIQEAHSHGIIHRDLKPSNIMVDDRGEPIVMDFGLARQTYGEGDIRLTHIGLLIGTPAYMSPEQVEAVPERIDASTDQYSLGVIFYELLTGKLPFDGSLTAVIGQIAAKTPKPPSQLRPDVDRRIEAACLRMMAKRPQNRFPSMRAVAHELAAILRAPADKRRPSATSIESSTVLPRKRTPSANGSSTIYSASDTHSRIALARRCLARHDYDEAVHILAVIPDSEQSEAIRVLLNKARELSDEVALVQVEIDEAVRLGDGSIAIAKAERLRELKPNHVRIKEIQQKFLREALPRSDGLTKGPLVTIWITATMLVLGVILFLFDHLLEGVCMMAAGLFFEVGAIGNYLLVTRPRKRRNET